MRKYGAVIASLAATVLIAAATPAEAQSPLTETFSTYEPKTNRPGSDIPPGIRLPGGAYPDLCASLCRQKPECLAWTFVEAGVQAQVPVCWLKSSVPPPIFDAVATSGFVPRPMWIVWVNETVRPAHLGVALSTYSVPGWTKMNGPFTARRAWEYVCNLHRPMGVGAYFSPDIANGTVKCADLSNFGPRG